MRLEPLDMALGLVRLVLAVAILVFLAEPPAELGKPHVIGTTLAHPDGTRVIHMRLLVGSLRELSCAHDVVGGIQQLSCLENHLHDVFVAVKARRELRAERQDEDVHGGHISPDVSTQIHF